MVVSGLVAQVPFTQWMQSMAGNWQQLPMGVHLTMWAMTVRSQLQLLQMPDRLWRAKTG